MPGTKTVSRSVSTHQASQSHLMVKYTLPHSGRARASHSLQCITELPGPFTGPLMASDILPSNLLFHSAVVDPPQLSPKPCASSPRDLHIKQYLSQGRVWDAFTATCTWHHHPGASMQYVTPSCARSEVVVKFTSPEINPMGVVQLRQEVLREAWIYDNILPDLQGIVVPRFHGIFSSVQKGPHNNPVRLLAAVMDDAGQAYTYDMLQSLSRSKKTAILDKYTALHEAGIVHTSCSSKHWLKKPRNLVSTTQLVDFGQSYIRNDYEGDIPSAIRVLGETEFDSRAESESLIVGRSLLLF